MTATRAQHPTERAEPLEPLIQRVRSIALEGSATACAGLVTDPELDEGDLWSAAALTAARYINNEAHNHMGFVSHALLGTVDARRLAAAQPIRLRRLALSQALHHVVADLHDPSFAPFELTDYWAHGESSVEQSVLALRQDVADGERMRADHRLAGLRDQLELGALIDLLLDIGLEGVTTDEHTILTPVAAAGLCARLGPARGYPALRWAVRYSASFPRDVNGYDDSIELMRRYGLTGGAPVRAGADLTAASELAMTFEHAGRPRCPELAAEALASGGCSPATVLAAASLTGCRQYLAAPPVPHEHPDAISREVAPVHIGTGLNAMREGLRMMSPRTAVAAAIQAGFVLKRGPSMLNDGLEFVPFEPGPRYPPDAMVARFAMLPARALLGAVREALTAREIDGATAAVAAYGDAGGAPAPLIRLLTEAACADGGTLMHAVKHLRSMVSEFRAAPEAQRWQYLIAAARFAAWYAGLNSGAYERMTPVLEAAAIDRETAPDTEWR